MNKRGGIFLVLIVVILILTSVRAEEWVQPILDIWSGETIPDSHIESKYGFLKTSWNSGKVFFQDSPTPEDFCEDADSTDQLGGSPDFADCGYENCCAIELSHYEWGGRDECSGTYVKGGTIISPYDSSLEYVGGDWDSNDGGYHPETVRGIDASLEYVCDNNVWKTCSAQTVGSFLDIDIYAGENGSGEEYTHKAYFCVPKNVRNTLVYSWLSFDDPTVDQDSDSVPIIFDCDDNDPDVFGNFTMYNPSAPQPRIICGDGKLNTCGAVADEVDECDDIKNEQACSNNCKVAGNACSWIQTDSRVGACCGDDGINDLGATATQYGGQDNGNNYLCLNKDKNLVGVDSDLTINS